MLTVLLMLLESEKCCFLNGTTVIDKLYVTFSGLENPEVDAIMFDDNKEISFLPVDVNKKFPNLEYFVARNASIVEVSAVNFRRLSKMKLLDLQENLIEFIPNFCFEDLSKLLGINLEKNKIATMNGAAFANLPRLVEVNLRDNVCIDKRFTIDRDPSLFRRKISRNCAPGDAGKKKVSCRAYTVCNHVVNDLFTNWFNRTSSCCKLDHEAYIDSANYSFVGDASYASLEVVYFLYQRNINFLPVSVHESFPILKFYHIINVPVQKIFKKNFEKLFQLVQLYLLSNRIEAIKSDTFEDLVSLRRIYIMRQHLLALNGQAFTNLYNLETIFLTQNNCIDKMFIGEEARENAIEQASTSCGFDEFESVEVSCERFQDYRNDLGMSVESCIMTKKTVINATNFVIADLKDEEVEGIIFEGNTDIEYLPYKIHMQFPNLDVYKASRCSIKQITKENFENLSRLKSIDLSFNQIQKVSTDTFKGLKNLLHVRLHYNQIKSINGQTFDQLPLLISVDLRNNECINDKLEAGQPIKTFTRKIIQNCAFTETGEREFERVFDIKCGVGMMAEGLMINGTGTKRREWPFMAALIFEPMNQLFCGGNVITASHVLTAAHCVQNKYEESVLDVKEIAILLGRHNISRAEVGSEIRGVKQIKIHPHWNPHDQKYEGDMAVLEMDRPVQFSELIQPVCLTVEPEISLREAGYVTGWGKKEVLRLYDNILQRALISSITTDVCLTKYYKLGQIFAPGMFCAGGDGSGPCHGDSGGGFFVKYHGLWTLRGIISSGSTRVDGGCNVDRYSLFTNVLDYTSWINDAVKKNVSTGNKSELLTLNFNVKVCL